MVVDDFLFVIAGGVVVWAGTQLFDISGSGCNGEGVILGLGKSKLDSNNNNNVIIIIIIRKEVINKRTLRMTAYRTRVSYI